MREMSYEFFSSHVTQRNFDEADKYTSILQVVEKFLDKEQIIVFYPKNLFVDEKQLEVQIYEKDRVVILNHNEEEVKVRVLKYQLIEKVELIYTGYYEPLTLKINFRTGDSLELNELDDTNSTWRRSFTSKIEEIFKLLS